MTHDRYEDLPPAMRRRVVAWAALRSLLVAAVLVVLYFVLPLDRAWDTDTFIRLLVGLLLCAVVLAWGAKSIAVSRYPGARGAETLGLIIPFFLLLFASTYVEMERVSAANFTQTMTRTDALYFTVTVFSTVGFGDIAAKSEVARVVVTVQMLADLAVLGLGIRVLLGAVRRGRERRPAPVEEPDRTARA